MRVSASSGPVRGSVLMRAALSSGETLLGTFVKTTHHQTVEVLAGSGLDVVVLDAEHAPFTRESLDACCLAAKACQIPVLIRTASARPEYIMQALDSGAQGVLVPHVDSPEIATDVIRAARYRESDGLRGFSNSSRAGGYGSLELAQHIEQSDRMATVIVQIESKAAVENVEQICRVRGVDALFVGRADLAVSYGVGTLTHPDVQKAVEHTLLIAREHGMPVGIFLSDTKEMETFFRLGARLFIVGSDQSLLKRGVADIISTTRTV